MKDVTAAIIIENGRVILTRRKHDQSLAGYWEFPGGKIEEGETPQICLEREIFEELGVRVKTGLILAESVYQYEHGKIRLIALFTELIDKQIVLEVHDKAEWVRLVDVLDYKLAPADISIAKTVMEMEFDA
jgi:8-oxo-dGTP diphosphatase